jgi:hypothetical protein
MRNETTPTVFIHGLNYGPGDCDALEQELGTEVIIPAIPLYRGEPRASMKKMDAGQVVQYEEELAAEVADSMMKEGCRNVIAHSRGTLFALIALRHMGRHGHAAENLTLMPACKDANAFTPFQGEDFEDSLLRPLCNGMDEKTYAALKQRHASTLKKSLKLMDPKKHGTSAERVREMVEEIAPKTRILVADCLQDPFRDPVRLREMIGNAPNVTISQPMPWSHFPHVQDPAGLVRMIREWQRQSVGGSSPPPIFTSPDAAVASSMS